MATREFGIRDLRNDTGRVIDAVAAGDTVFITKRGVRVAELRPVDDPPSRVAQLLDLASRLPKRDTGALDELLRAKEQDVEAQEAKAWV